MPNTEERITARDARAAEKAGPKFSPGEIIDCTAQNGREYQNAFVIKWVGEGSLGRPEFRETYSVSTPDGMQYATDNKMTLVARPISGDASAAAEKPAESSYAVFIAGRAWKVKTTTESVARKMQPVGTVAKEYFPLARRAEAAVSWVGNEKHNPGERLHWARGKSDDHLDCAGRHMTENEDWDVTVLPDGRVFAVLHAAQHAWRASALAQLAAEKYGGMVIMELEGSPGGG